MAETEKPSMVPSPHGDPTYPQIMHSSSGGSPPRGGGGFPMHHQSRAGPRGGGADGRSHGEYSHSHGMYIQHSGSGQPYIGSPPSSGGLQRQQQKRSATRGPQQVGGGGGGRDPYSQTHGVSSGGDKGEPNSSSGGSPSDRHQQQGGPYPPYGGQGIPPHAQMYQSHQPPHMGPGYVPPGMPPMPHGGYPPQYGGPPMPHGGYGPGYPPMAGGYGYPHGPPGYGMPPGGQFGYAGSYPIQHPQHGPMVGGPHGGQQYSPPRRKGSSDGESPSRSPPKKSKDEDDRPVGTSSSAKGDSVLLSPSELKKREEEEEKISEEIAARVDPMRSDFHFFVLDVRDKIQPFAKEEVLRSLASDTSSKFIDKKGRPDPFLLFTNLNTRLMKAWEECPSKKKVEYLSREEEDRKRFMNDEEIASRHCATLTARAKSPKAPGTGDKSPSRGVKKEQDVDEEDAKEIVTSVKKEDGADVSKGEGEVGISEKEFIREREERKSHSKEDKADEHRSDKVEAFEEGGSDDENKGCSDVEGKLESPPHRRESERDEDEHDELPKEEESPMSKVAVSSTRGKRATRPSTPAGMHDTKGEDPTLVESPSKKNKRSPSSVASSTSPLATNNTMKELYGDFFYSKERHGNLSSTELRKLADAIAKEAHPSSKNKKSDLFRLNEEREKFLQAAKKREEGGGDKEASEGEKDREIDAKSRKSQVEEGEEDQFLEQRFIRRTRSQDAPSSPTRTQTRVGRSAGSESRSLRKRR